MEHFYNQKIRYHGNGLVEIRLYEKAFSFGGIKKGKTSELSGYEYIDVPFEEKPIKSRRFRDGNGFTIPYERDKLSMYKSVKRTKDKVYDYANALAWKWFVTFMFDGEKVDRYNYDEVSKKFSQWLKNARKLYAPDMQYVVVPERHKDGAYHFHGLFSNCDGLEFVPALNMAETYKGKPNKYYGQPLVRNGRQIYDMKKFRFGWSDCQIVEDTKKCANYILKYITKDLIEDTPERKRYWCSKNLPKVREEHILNDGNYDDIVKNILIECAKKNPHLYSRECELQNGDFSNRVLFIKL